MRTAAALIFAACVAVTLRDGVWLAGTRHSRLEPGLNAALGTLRERTPADATVLSLWNHGYEIQRYAARATLVDGLLESDVVRRRVVETAGAFMQPTTDSLVAVCRYGAEWLLVQARRTDGASPACGSRACPRPAVPRLRASTGLW